MSKMSKEEYESAVARSEDFLDMLKDQCQDQYEQIQELEQKNKKLEDKVKELTYAEKYFKDKYYEETERAHSLFSGLLEKEIKINKVKAFIEENGSISTKEILNIFNKEIDIEDDIYYA